VTRAKARLYLLFQSVGDVLLRLVHDFGETLVLMSEMVTWSLGLVFTRTGVRRGAFTRGVLDYGLMAFPILFIIMFLVGFVSALQAAAQLKIVGGNIFVADLLAIGMTAEMGPLMTAVVVAGRSGSSIASEVATMKYTEELDALSTMGLSPLKFVMVPKLWAMLFVMPVLILFAETTGILGGTTIAVTYLHLSFTSFWRELSHALFFKNILSSIVKSVVFGLLITVTACHKGLQFKGGAEGVGRSTTSSVVTSLFYIIAADSILGLLFYF
jgi:phospholipid/cholesterol/gamma-HCH transport system permease protein